MPADPETVFEPWSLAHWGPKKPETTQKLGQNKKSDWKGAIWNDPKTVLELYPNHQNWPLWAKYQKLPKNRLQLKVRIDGTL